MERLQAQRSLKKKRRTCSCAWRLRKFVLYRVLRYGALGPTAESQLEKSHRGTQRQPCCSTRHFAWTASSPPCPDYVSEWTWHPSPPGERLDRCGVQDSQSSSPARGLRSENKMYGNTSGPGNRWMTESRTVSYAVWTRGKGTGAK